MQSVGEGDVDEEEGHHDDPYAKDALKDGSLVQADYEAPQGAVPLVRTR